QRVVVASRRRCLGVGARPLLAVRLRDLANLGSIQTRPAFLKRRKAFPPVIARARFDAQIVVEAAQMNSSSLAEGHFRRNFAVTVASAFAMLFKEFGQLRFGHAEM